MSWSEEGACDKAGCMQMSRGCQGKICNKEGISFNLW